MVYDPNANWSTEITSSEQSPVYFLRLDGISTTDYATGAVQSAAVTKSEILSIPQSGSVILDIIDGTRSKQQVAVELVDKDGEATALVATEASGAPVSTLINRKGTIYGGYRNLVESDYPAIFTGRVTGVAMLPEMTGYRLTMTDFSHLLDGEIMSNASTTTNTTIEGNLVNVYWSILSGTFSTSHATFPLDTVSGATPTGLGIAEADINSTQLTTERDRWHLNDTVKLEFDDSTAARQYLEDELFRIFQCWPAISQDGLIGLKFHAPPMPASSAPTITEDEILGKPQWTRLLDDHLNKFTYSGDYSLTTNTYDGTLYSTQTADDTADQSATGETIEYLGESQWLRTANDGVNIATELAGRHRIRYLKTPAKLELDVSFAKRNIEDGDVVALTHSKVPDLLTGTTGVTAKLMTVVGIRPRYEEGRLRLTLLDTGYQRYGVIAPSGQADYTASTAQEKNSFVYVSDGTTNNFSDGDPGYRLA